PVDEPAMPEIEGETQLDVRLFQPREVRALEQRLVKRNRPAYLSLRAVQVAEDHLDLERVGVAEACRLRQFLDGLIDLVVDQKVEAEHVVWRLAQATTVDPPAVTQ